EYRRVPWGTTRTFIDVRADLRAARSPLRLLRLHELVGGAFQRTARLGAPQDDLFDLAGKREVPVGNATGRVGLELDPELSPGDREIGVMIRGLAEVADRVCQHQRRRPAIGVVLAADPAVLEVPVGQSALLERGGD